MPLTPNVYLDFDIENKRARVIDNTNYADNDIVLASQNAKGLGVVTGPTGVAIISANTVGNPLVNLAVSTNGQYFNLPLDANGEVLNGTYAFTYAVRYAGTGSIDTITAPSTAQLEFANAGAVLQDGDPIVFTGNANVNNNGTFTIATATYNLGLDTTTITVDQTTLVNASPATGSFSYDVTRSGFATGTYTWNGCIKVTPAVTVTYNCESTQFGQIIFSDSSSLNGQELVSRSLTGFYPNALNPAPPTESVTTSTTSLTFNELAVGTWSHNLTLVMTYTQPDGLVVNYTVVDTGETKVTCVGTLCGLTPCIESIKDKYAAAFNTGKASGLEPIILMILQLYALAKEYRTCGEYDKYASTVAQLEQVLDKSGHCECGCCDESKDVPYWVDNSNFDAQTIIDELVENVTILQGEVANQVTSLFNGQNFYGSATGYPNATLTLASLGSIEIPASYLDFPIANGYGNKTVEINIEAETGSTGANVSVNLLNGGGTTLLNNSFSAPSSVAKLIVRMVLVIEKDGADYNLWALTNLVDYKDDGSVAFSSDNNVFVNALTSGEAIELNLRPVDLAAEAKTTYTYVSIVGKNKLI